MANALHLLYTALQRFRPASKWGDTNSNGIQSNLVTAFIWLLKNITKPQLIVSLRHKD
jgi:hypothetical protein